MDESLLLALLSGVREGPICFGRISSYQAALIGAHSTTVWLSHATVEKIEGKHRDPSLSLYRAAHAALLATMDRVRVAPPNKLNFLFQTLRDERGKQDSYRITVKATRSGSEIYLVSAHKLRGNQWRATMNRTLSASEWERRQWLVRQPEKV